MSAIVTICARSGSKGIKNKNILKIKSKPLIYYTIEQAIRVVGKENIYLSTDSIKIINLVKHFGINIPFIRPKYLSNDKAGKLNVINHLIKFINKKKINYKYIIDLDPTSPLRNVIDIKNCIELIKNKKISNIISICEARKNPFFNMAQIKNNKLKKIYKRKHFKTRQEAPKVYELNASIYAWKKNTFSLELFQKNTYPYLMPKNRSIDVDDEFDLKILKFLIK